MQRILTAAVALPLVATAVFWLQGPWSFFFFLAAVEIAVFEYVRLARSAGAGRAVWTLPAIVALAALLMSADLWRTPEGGTAERLILLCAFLLSGVAGIATLAGRGGVDKAFLTVGSLSFGAAYFSVAVASLHRIHAAGPWLLVLLLAIVWAGDSAAYYAGCRWGKRKLAPEISPNKTWLGAGAGLAAGLAAAAVWGWWRHGGIGSGLLLLAALTGVAAQAGDLIESMIKRSAGVKDSGVLLPGHGGMFDRLDALLLAAPVFVFLTWILGLG